MDIVDKSERALIGRAEEGGEGMDFAWIRAGRAGETDRCSGAPEGESEKRMVANGQVSVTEVARRIRVPMPTVYSWMARGLSLGPRDYAQRGHPYMCGPCQVLLLLVMRELMPWGFGVRESLVVAEGAEQFCMAGLCADAGVVRRHENKNPDYWFVDCREATVITRVYGASAEPLLLFPYGMLASVATNMCSVIEGSNGLGR